MSGICRTGAFLCPTGAEPTCGGPERSLHGMRASLAMWTILAPGRASDTFSS